MASVTAAATTAAAFHHHHHRILLKPLKLTTTVSFQRSRHSQIPLFSSSFSTNYNNNNNNNKLSSRIAFFFVSSASANDETLLTDDVITENDDVSQLPPQAEDSEDATTDSDSSESDGTVFEESQASSILASLQAYKEALADNDESKISEIETYLKSVEDEKLAVESRLAALSDELSSARDRVLRISADFDNFRKRTERERISLVANAQGEVVENLLPVLDNFERAKASIKVENEKEEKINNSYQSIYKQFVEILNSLGVVPVETIGQPFDPLANPRVGSKFSRVLDDLFQRLSGFIKT